MKKFILLSIISLLFGFSNAQIILENNFDKENIMRINLDLDGEKYATFLPDSQKLKIYNTDKTLWRAFNFYIDPNSEYDFYNFSQTLVNNDTLIEVTYGYRYSTSNPYILKIVSEVGNTIFTLNDIYYANSFFTDDYFTPKYLKFGNETKLVLNVGTEVNGGMRVYSLPNFQVEHIYNNFYMMDLENEGKKIFEINYDYQTATYILNIYNINHSLFKSIVMNINSNLPIDFMGEYFQLKVLDISKIKFNDDELIEVFLKLDFGIDLSSGFLNSQHRVLLIGFKETGFMFINPNQLGVVGNAKLIKDGNTNYLISYYGNNISGTSKLYSLPELQIIYNYNNYRGVVELDGIGGKLVNWYHESGLLKFYNLDNTHWKDIQLPTLGSNTVFELFKISSTYFDNDTLLEVLYRATLPNNGIMTNNNKCVIFKENTGVIFQIDSCIYFSISIIDGLQHKIIGSIATFDGSNYYGTKTYVWEEGVNRFLGNNEFENLYVHNKFNFYPNPANDIIYLDIESENFSPNELTIRNLQGQKLLSTHILNKSTKVDISHLSNGIYFINAGGNIKKLIKY